MSKEGRQLETVMILMTAIIGRLFNKHHRSVYCITRKPRRGGGAVWLGAVLSSLTRHCGGVPDLSKMTSQSQYQLSLFKRRATQMIHIYCPSVSSV